MSKVKVEWDRYLSQTLAGLREKGLLLSSVDSQGRPNAMAIGWASFGIEWSRPIATVMVRPSRYTFGCIELTNDFTISVPYSDLDEQVLFCGTASGRDVDKFAECGFDQVHVEGIRSPGIGQAGLIYFCRVVHRNDVLASQLDEEIQADAYPKGDYHRFYYGLIHAVLADEDFEERYGR